MTKDLGTPAWGEDYRHWFAGLKQRTVASAQSLPRAPLPKKVDVFAGDVDVGR